LIRKVGAAPDAPRLWSLRGAVFIVEAANLTDIDRAMRAVRKYSLAFWDALLWATARRAGVSLLARAKTFRMAGLSKGFVSPIPFDPANTPIAAAMGY
jgi:predicted nucleic acid-binding protein